VVSKIIKKISFLFFVLSLSVVFNSMIQNSAEAKCQRDSNNAIKVTTGDDTVFALTGTETYDQDNCNEEPLFYKVRFFRLALCTSDPYNAGDGTDGVAPDLSSCTNIWTGDKTIVIQPGKTTELINSFDIAAGTYTHAYTIVSNHLSVKHYDRFALASNGSEATMYGYAASGDQTGNYCWTKSTTTTYNNDYNKTLHGLTLPSADLSGTSATNTMVCGDSAPSASTSSYDYAIEIIDHLGDDNVTDDSTAFRNFLDYLDMEGINGQVAGLLMQSDGSSLASTVANGRRLAHIQTLLPKLDVDEKTVGINLSFNTSESVSIDTAVNSSNTHAIKVGADPFGLNFSLFKTF
tara:strand:+ start:95 stop:1141 length:1047 start_codon:yes stop_codon:yes gene_type:complete